MRNLLVCMLFFIAINRVYAQGESTRVLTFHIPDGQADRSAPDAVLRYDIHIETFKCYLSGITLWSHQQQVWEEPNSFHLIDLSHPSSMTLTLRVPAGIAYDHIRFNVGLDSVTNVSGALGGDLDPTKGMYWTWQSGYINMKLEGTCNSGKSGSQPFQFHLGGYQYPYNTLQQVVLPVNQQQPIQIALDIRRFLKELDVWQTPGIMSPCVEAVIMSRQFVHYINSTVP